ncbi:hypothetical protein PVAND_007602 [Polypedilum vanderplanki]|uniref:Exuperantia SAM-like domain-containing protein n=1 Tax=Polypedilum vanderplanki TaxID=319348 RepID=A0A9J6C7G2_POLVA|nr:hypothetical protein PVAND_007602 [Polypedilum vanderplanki]
MSTEKQYSKLEGNYTYVGFDIDTTGRRLIDEIVHIAAYTPDDAYSQYIMPLMNLNPVARNRHQIRVITVGFFRMLKSMQTYKVIKTKTEIAAIMEFLEWLEKINGEKDGVILMYHDQPKITPYMLIEKMKKFNLFERFKKTVKSFVNGYDLNNFAEKGKGLKYLTLSANFKVHADQLNMNVKEPEDFEGCAAVRAKLSYEICKLISYEGEQKELDDKQVLEQMNRYISAKANPIERELDELVEMEESISRQTDMRDIFLTYFSTSRYHRRRALIFRRSLADIKIDKTKLQEIWNNEKREGLEKIVKTLESIKEEVDREELVNILEHHFDEEKKPLKPLVRNGNSNRNRNHMRRRNSRSHKDGRGSSRSNSRRPNRNNSRRRMSHREEMNSKTGMIHKDQQQEYDHANNVAAAN